MWKYTSQDSENIVLHDNAFDEILIENNDILLTFSEGFDIVKWHPLNDTGKSKHTAESQIVLKNAKFICGEAVYWTKEIDEKFISGKSARRTKEVTDFEEFLNDFSLFEIMDFVIGNGEIIFDGLLFPVDGKTFKDQYEMILLFSCAGVVFCWSDYSKDSWFADIKKPAE